MGTPNTNTLLRISKLKQRKIGMDKLKIKIRIQLSYMKTTLIQETTKYTMVNQPYSFQ